MTSTTRVEDPIKKVLAAHRAWLENPATGLRADLTGYTLNEAQLQSSNLSKAVLSRATFLDANLAQALMSIQAVKAVEIGDGWDNAARRGSDAHDAIHYDEVEGYVRPTDRAGGIEGGISNGALLVARVAMKPLATLNRPVLQTVDVVTKESTVSFRERTDVTAVPAMGVVAESMTALVLATEALRKFGGDSLAEMVRNRDGLQMRACLCNESVKSHFEEVLRGVYPTEETGRSA